MIPCSPISIAAVIFVLILAGLLYLIGLGICRAVRWLKERP